MSTIGQSGRPAARSDVIAVMKTHRRDGHKPTWLLVIAAGSLILAACGAAGSDVGNDSDHEASSSTTVTTTTMAEALPAAGTLPDGPSALSDPGSPEFPDPLVPIDEIISGGPPPDGIPPIDSPVFVDVIDNLDIIDPNEPVVALEINGDARAYPVRAMIWHEIVNDTVGGVPVSVTYCPLCNSAVSYRREINGVETTFGTSGRLFASALVMYDRATQSLWTHFDGRAVVGVLTGTQLESIPSPLLAWDEFRSTYPTGQVLDFENLGFRRDYGRNPYTGYDNPDSNPFLFRGTLDDRAKAKQRVVGVTIDEVSTAFSLEFLSDGEAKATNTTIGEVPIVILWKSGQASALDGFEISEGFDVGSVGVFDPAVDGQLLTFEVVAGEFLDLETRSTWNVTGEATAGSLVGTRLTRLDHLDTFWFAWSTYRPGTDLIEG